MILIALVLVCFFLSDYSRIALVLVAAALSAWEAGHALEGTCNVRSATYVTIIVLAFSALYLKLGGHMIFLEGIVFLGVVAIALVAILDKNVRGAGAMIAWAVLAYPGIPYLFLMKLSLHERWPIIFALGCISTWVCDSFAMFGGKWWGKHKLTPEVSPKKTVEGTITGAVSSLVVGAILYFVFQDSYSLTLPCALVTAFVASSFGQVGDLAASLLKRLAGVKDYSNLIPGHGGVLDRTDSLLFSVPCAYFCLSLFGVI